MVEMPQDAREAMTIGAWLEALGPRFVQLMREAANKDALTDPVNYPHLSAMVLPVSGAVTLLARQLAVAEQAIVELQQAAESTRKAVQALAAREEAMKGHPAAVTVSNPVTEVRWTGSWDNLPAAIPEIAREIVVMHESQRAAHIEGQMGFDDVIDTTESGPKQPISGPNEPETPDSALDEPGKAEMALRAVQTPRE